MNLHSTFERMLAGVNEVAKEVGYTMGPLGKKTWMRNTTDDSLITQLDHGLNVANKVKSRDSVELIGVKLMRKVAERANDQVGDGTSTTIILANGLITESVKAVTAGADRTETLKGVERTIRALVKELKLISRKVTDFVDVIKINTRNNDDIGLAVARAKTKVGREGVISLETEKTEEPAHVLEGLHVGRRHLFPLYVIDRKNKLVEYENCKLLLADKITYGSELLTFIKDAEEGGFLLVIIAQHVQEEAVHYFVTNKPPGLVAILKATGFGGRKIIDDVAILTKGTVIRREAGLTIENAGREVLGFAAQVLLTKHTTMIVGDGSTQALANIRAAKIEELAEAGVNEVAKKVGDTMVQMEKR